jgi:hypothetical protein
MKDDTLTLIFVGILIGLVIGCLMGGCGENGRMKQEAITHHVAHYNSTNADFEWNN